MRENNDRTFAKSRILVGKATGDIVILVLMIKASVNWP